MRVCLCMHISVGMFVQVFASEDVHVCLYMSAHVLFSHVFFVSCANVCVF